MTLELREKIEISLLLMEDARQTCMSAQSSLESSSAVVERARSNIRRFVTSQKRDDAA